MVWQAHLVQLSSDAQPRVFRNGADGFTVLRKAPYRGITLMYKYSTFRTSRDVSLITVIIIEVILFEVKFCSIREY